MRQLVRRSPACRTDRASRAPARCSGGWPAAVRTRLVATLAGEPCGLRLRLIHMTPLLLTALAALTPALLVGCGSTAPDEAGTSETGASTTPPASAGRPAGPPWPRFPEDDYSYELVLNCYCADRGPFVISVHDGRVSDVVYGRGAVGHPAGQPASSGWVRLTIDDLIRRANDPSTEVDVRWPQAQAYPSWVWINRSQMPVDGGIQYRLRNVRLSGTTRPSR